MAPLGKSMPSTPSERQQILIKIVSEYCKLIRQGVRGDYRDPVSSQSFSLPLQSPEEESDRMLLCLSLLWLVHQSRS